MDLTSEDSLVNNTFTKYTIKCTHCGARMGYYEGFLESKAQFYCWDPECLKVKKENVFKSYFSSE
jgi:hypothetical protein